MSEGFGKDMPLGRDLLNYREEFPLLEDLLFLNHAAVAPVPLRAVREAQGLLESFSREGMRAQGQWMKRVEGARACLARLIHAGPGEVAFVSGASEALSLVAQSLDWKEGDGVLIPQEEFPSNVYAWQNLERRGVRVYRFPRKEGRFSVQDVRNALAPGIRLVSVGSVDFLTGFRCDVPGLGALCKEKGLLFCVDATQELGQAPVDVRASGIDFLCASGYKWLLGPLGTGFLYVGAERIPSLHPPLVGWKSVADEEDFFSLRFRLKEDAGRFEPGALNIPGIAALGAAAGLLEEAGVERIRTRILALGQGLDEGLKSLGLRTLYPGPQEERSGIVTFVPKGPPGKLHAFLSPHALVSLRGGMLRVSPHFTNSEEDIERFLGLLGCYLR